MQGLFLGYTSGIETTFKVNMQDKLHPDQVPKNWPFPTYMGKQIEVGKVKKEPNPALDTSKFEVALF